MIELPRSAHSLLTRAAMLATTSIVACATNSVRAPMVPAASAPVSSEASPEAPSPVCQKNGLKWVPVGSPSEAKEIDEEICRLQTILGLPDLWSNYDVVASKYAALQIDSSGGQAITMTPTEAKKLLQEPSSVGYLRRPVHVELVGTYYKSGKPYSGTCTRNDNQGRAETVNCRATQIRQNYMNMNVGTNGIGWPPRGGGDEDVVIEIGREIFRRHFDADPIKRSCMVNTLAHEWVHTISKPGTAHWSVVTDDESAPATTPSLPQFFGSIAQCTWLQNEGLVERSAGALAVCVARFGENTFKSAQCDS